MEKEKEKEQEPEKKSRRPKKAKGGHGGHHGGAWKVAYADFVTAMMALFLVLWLVSQADTQLKEEIANYFRSPGAFKSSRGGVLPGSGKVSKEPKKLDPEAEQQALFGVAQNLKEKFSENKFEGLKDKVKLELTDEGLKINIIDKADNVSFDVGGAKLGKDAESILGEIALAICKLPNPIKIGGHTDSRNFPTDNGYSNWELSADRANSARRELQKVCVKPSQIHRITGYADTQPINPDDRYDPANRRISITVLRINNSDIKTEENTNVPIENFERPKQTESRSKKPKIAKTTKPKSSPSPSPEKEDKKADKTKKPLKTDLKETLKKEGEVKVGKPDKIPKNVTKTKPKETDS